MFRDDFDEFRARSYSGGFLSFAVDGKRSTSDPTRYYFESTATDSETTGTDVTVTEIDVLPGRVRERRHSDEMPRNRLPWQRAPVTGIYLWIPSATRLRS